MFLHIDVDGISYYNTCFNLVYPTATNYKGCFIDSEERDLPHRILIDPEMTVEKCIAHCEGYTYAGVQVLWYMLPYEFKKIYIYF